ncbi:MAG: M20 family metallopeptidase [Candidatus Thorarchaeota archaeon]
MQGEDLKKKVCTFIENNKDSLFKISKEIYDNPELAFKEYKASKLLASELEEAGFKVELGVAELETAIQAIHPKESEGQNVAIIGEYDALPELGHACGHNLIATAALGASLALGSIKEELPGKLIFLGTPAEEGGGGKIFMINAGLFRDIDAAMMFHPSASYTVTGRGGLAVTEVKIEFFGKSSHASGSPEKGINALDAVIQTFNGINALRQHITSDARIHGIITHGGIKPNIVPEYAAASFYVRALDDDYCEDLIKKVENCAKGAALSTGAELKFERVGHSYRSRKANLTLGKAFEENLKILDEPIVPIPPNSGLGSSDIGNVSHEVPTIHPYIAIAQEGVAGHSREFAKASISEKGQQKMLVAAKALAMTAIDVFTNIELVEKMKREFEKK